VGLWGVGYAALLILGFASPCTRAQDNPLIPSDLEVAQVRIDAARILTEPSGSLELRVRGVTADGGHVPDLAASAIRVWDDDELVAPESMLLEQATETDAPLALAIAIDLTGSMRGEPLRNVKRAVSEFLAGEKTPLRSNDRVSILGFAEEVVVKADPGLLRLDTRAMLDELEVDPERSQRSRIFDGVFRAIQTLRDSEDDPRTIPVVVVYADGGDSGSDADAEAVIGEALGEPGQSAVPVFGIGDARFGSRGLEALRRICAETGGRYWQLQSPADVGPRFDEIMVQMLASWFLRVPRDFDGASHRIQVAIGQADATRSVRYPEPPRSSWPWLALLGLIASGLALSAAFWWWRAAVGRLTVVTGVKVGVTYGVRRGRNSLGSLPDNDIVIDSNMVSRHHAELLVRGKHIQIVDLRSRNGVYVNGKQVDRAVLHPGDHVTVADVELLYE